MNSGHFAVVRAAPTLDLGVMKLRVVLVGRDRGDPIVEASEVYVERLARSFPTHVVEVREEPARAHAPPDRVRAEEAKRILEQLAPGEVVVALEVGGRALTSEDVAARLDRARMEGRGLTFVIGGPLGLDASVRQRAQEVWSLSKLTLPHRIARLVLLEQLYRASTILRGEPYHK
jgi:23S rRNA (pseudouridine1915-N3)-methyltransferase